MPVEAPRALQDEVDGCEVRDHQIEVHIERLLKHLRPDDDLSVRTVSGWSELVDEVQLTPQPVRSDKAAVQKDRLISELLADTPAGLLRSRNSVASDCCASSGFPGLSQAIDELIHIVRAGFEDCGSS